MSVSLCWGWSKAGCARGDAQPSPAIAIRCIQPQQSHSPAWPCASNNTWGLIKTVFFISLIRYLVITSERAKEFLYSPHSLPRSFNLLSPLLPFCPFGVLSLVSRGLTFFSCHEVVTRRKPGVREGSFIPVALLGGASGKQCRVPSPAWPTREGARRWKCSLTGGEVASPSQQIQNQAGIKIPELFVQHQLSRKGSATGALRCCQTFQLLILVPRCCPVCSASLPTWILALPCQLCPQQAAEMMRFWGKNGFAMHILFCSAGCSGLG